MAENKTLSDVIDRLKAEGNLTRNSGTNSLKSVKEILIQSQKDSLADKEIQREQSIRDEQQGQIFTSMDSSLESIANALSKAGGSTPSEGGGFLSSGLGAILAGGGIGLGAAGAGIGAFFMGLAGAEAIMTNFGTGDNLKKLLTNLAEGLAEFETRDLTAIGAVLGAGAVAGALPGLSGVGAGLGMAWVGAGLGGFFAGLTAADAAMSWMSTDMTSLKKATKGLSDALGELDERSLTVVGGLLAAGAGAGALFSTKRVGKATIGMGAIGLGIGAFFAGLTAGDAAMSWMNTDGTALKNVMKNVGEGLKSFADNEDSLKILGGLLAGGAAAGAIFGPSTMVKSGIGMGAVGLGLGGFFAGLAAGDAAASWMTADGETLKKIMKNLAEGLGAFADGDLDKLSGLLVAGGLFGAVPGGAALVGGAAVGMGLIGAGLGAFFTGFAGIGDLAGVIGSDGSGMRDIMVNTAEGLKAFNDLNGSNLLAVAGGLAAIGPAMAVYLGGEGLGAIGGAIIDNAKSAYEWLFGSDEGGTPDPGKSRIQGIVDGLRPLNDLEAQNLDAFVELTNVLDKFAESLEGIADNGPRFKSAMRGFAEGMEWSIPLFNAIANGGEYDPSGAGDYDFGNGLLDPNLQLDELMQKMMMVRSIVSGMPMMNEVLAPTGPTVQQIPNQVSTTGADLDAAQVTITDRPTTSAPVITSAPTTVDNSSVVNQSQGVIDTRQEVYSRDQIEGLMMQQGTRHGWGPNNW